MNSFFFLFFKQVKRVNEEEEDVGKEERSHNNVLVVVLGIINSLLIYCQQWEGKYSLRPKLLFLFDVPIYLHFFLKR